MLLPPPLLEDLRQIKGFDEAAFIAAHQRHAVTSVRVNPGKKTEQFNGMERVPWCENGYYLPERPVFTLDPAYHAGAYYVQEASSMFLEHVMRHITTGREGLRVLDLCAAPGGKSTLIAGILDAESLLISNEVIRPRATILEENMVRWGYTNAWATSNDPRSFSRLDGYFDIIVVDAPCSGSGLFRKDERALTEWSESNVQLCAGRQQRIITDVWPGLKENGLLIYATCSYSPAEDEGILDWLSSAYNTISISVPLTADWGITEVVSAKGSIGYRFFPDKVKGEGFFIAVVSKQEEVNGIQPPKFRQGGIKKIKEQADHLLKEGDFVFLQDMDEDYFAILAAHEADLQLLSKSLYFRKAGVKLGRPSAKEWLPHHEVALSKDANTALRALNLNKDQALRFLKKEDIGLPGDIKGWHIICYNGLGLGWIKGLGNRINNYLPKNWRIRMELPDEDI